MGRGGEQRTDRPRPALCVHPATRQPAARETPAPPALKPFVSILTTSSPFNSLFKVLFIFRSRYLFAIGLRVIFRLARNSSGALRHKSQSVRLEDSHNITGPRLLPTALRGSHPLRRLVPKHFGRACPRCAVRLSAQVRGRCMQAPTGFSRWPLPASLAVTGGITVVFFSSA